MEKEVIIKMLTWSHQKEEFLFLLWGKRVWREKGGIMHKFLFLVASLKLTLRVWLAQSLASRFQPNS